MKNNKLENIICYIFSIILSFIFIYSKKVVYSNDVFSRIDANYINDIAFKDIIFIILISILVFNIIAILSYVFKLYINKYIYKENKETKLPLMLIFTLIIIIAWIPYILSYYPGCTYSDAFTSMDQILYGRYDNHHTLLYTGYLGTLATIGQKINNYNIVIFFYTITQVIIMASILSYTLKWMYKNNINKIYIIITLLIYMFFPLFPYYAIATWKDTYFSLALLLYVIYLIDFVRDKKSFNNIKDIIYYLILNFFVCFLRNNGLYIIIFTFLIFIILNRKEILKKYKYFSYITFAGIVIVYTIQGPLYSIYYRSTEDVESLSMPMQTIGAIVSHDGNYKDEEEFISNIWSITEIKEKYTPCLADTMKWYMESFNQQYLIDNKGKLIKTWFVLMIKNPKISFSAIMLENLGFWHPKYSSNITYIQDGMWPNNYSLENIDYIYKITGHSFKNIVTPKHYISSGLLFWITFTIAMIVIRNSNIKRILPFIPIIGLWGTLMVATPIAFSLRYIYILILILPLLPILPEILKEKQ